MIRDLRSRESGAWWLGMAAFGVLQVLACVELARSDHALATRAGALGAATVFAVLVVHLAVSRPPRVDVSAAPVLGLLGVIAVPLTLLVSHQLFFLSTVGALAGLLLPSRAAILSVAVATVTVFGLSLPHESLAGSFGYAAQIGAICIACYGWSRLGESNAELDLARQEVARLAVAEERERFGRELHDLLGHSLSVILVKGELALRLVERDPQRARAEVGDIEVLARSALSEVRQAVTGYQPDLRTEMSHAVSALTAAGVRARVDADADGVSDDAAMTLAWVLREGTTNVVRHSRAQSCTISLRHECADLVLEVSDDGRGATAGEGHGLRGIRERVRAAGGEVDVSGGCGFRLRVRIPAVPA